MEALPRLTATTAAALWLAGGWPVLAAAQSSGIAIHTHQSLSNLTMRSRAELRTLAKPALPEPDLSFTAFGRSFRLLLESNDRLLDRLPQERREALRGVEVYRGSLPSVPGSWARITRAGTEVSGMIFDGAEYYAIDAVEHVADLLISPAADSGGTVIYRLSDTTGLFRDEVRDDEAIATASGVTQKSGIVSSLMSLSGLALGLQIDIGAVGDAELSQLVGVDDPEASMLRLLNTVDGIFLEGIGVQINVVELQSFSAEPDPFSSTAPGTLLSELENFKEGSPLFRPLGLLHLFTGRDLDDTSPSQGETVGVANLGVLCEPRRGVGLSQAYHGGGIDAIVAAHEIGHNFGAPHDAEAGSACAMAPSGMLMGASVTRSTEFSQCSLDQILTHISSATCLTPLLPTNMSLSLLSAAPPLFIEPDVSYAFDIRIENNSAVDAAGVRFVVDAPAMSVGFSSEGGARFTRCEMFYPHNCYWAHFPAGGYHESRVFFMGGAPGPATIDVSVTSLTESDVTDDTLHFEVDVLPTVNLRSDLDPPALNVRPGESSSVTATVANIGTEPATEVLARVQFGHKLEFLGTSIGACTWDGKTYLQHYDCPIGAIAPGESIDFVVDFQMRDGLTPFEIKDGASVAVVVESFEPERLADTTDNVSRTMLTLGDSIGDLAITQQAADTAVVGESFAFVEVSNNGPDTINDVGIDLFEFSGSAQPVLTDITATGGSCLLPVANSDRICEIPEIAAGQSIGITLSITTSRTGDFRLFTKGVTSSSDTDTANDHGTSWISVRAAPPAPPMQPSSPSQAATQSGSGGGGAADPLTFLLGALAVLARRARQLQWQRGRARRL